MKQKRVLIWYTEDTIEISSPSEIQGGQKSADDIELLLFSLRTRENLLRSYKIQVFSNVATCAFQRLHMKASCAFFTPKFRNYGRLGCPQITHLDKLQLSYGSFQTSSENDTGQNTFLHKGRGKKALPKNATNSTSTELH